MRKSVEKALKAHEALVHHTIAAQIWAAELQAPEEVLTLKPDWRKPHRSRSDRRRGLDGKRHRLARARAHTASMISVHRERNFEVGEERMLRRHVVHHLCVMNAKVEKAKVITADAMLSANRAISFVI